MLYSRPNSVNVSAIEIRVMRDLAGLRLNPTNKSVNTPRLRRDECNGRLLSLQFPAALPAEVRIQRLSRDRRTTMNIRCTAGFQLGFPRSAQPAPHRSTGFSPPAMKTPLHPGSAAVRRDGAPRM